MFSVCVFGDCVCSFDTTIDAMIVLSSYVHVFCLLVWFYLFDSWIFSWLYGFFFFMQKTAYEMRISDWSSDVCSSDLPLAAHVLGRLGFEVVHVESTQRRDASRWGDPTFYAELRAGAEVRTIDLTAPDGPGELSDLVASADIVIEASRSEERRVGKERVSTCSYWWGPYK